MEDPAGSTNLVDRVRLPITHQRPERPEIQDRVGLRMQSLEGGFISYLFGLGFGLEQLRGVGLLENVVEQTIKGALRAHIGEQPFGNRPV